MSQPGAGTNQACHYMVASVVRKSSISKECRCYFRYCLSLRHIIAKDVKDILYENGNARRLRALFLFVFSSFASQKNGKRTVARCARNYFAHALFYIKKTRYALRVDNEAFDPINCYFYLREVLSHHRNITQ